MNKFAGKFALIGLTTVMGFYAFWPPDTKLKTGIDLSGGTILVYEIKQEKGQANSGSPLNIDELITTLKRRVNPEGVLDIGSRSSIPRRPPRTSRTSSRRSPTSARSSSASSPIASTTRA
jgi:preprotein translocase subunit SecD